MLGISSIENVDQRVRDRIGNAYEVFVHEGEIFINAPRDSSEGENPEAPFCVLVGEFEWYRDEDELYVDCLHASRYVDDLMSEHVADELMGEC